MFTNTTVVSNMTGKRKSPLQSSIERNPLPMREDESLVKPTPRESRDSSSAPMKMNT